MDCLLDKYHQHFHQNISLLHHRRNRRQPFALWVMQTPPFCLFSTQVWFYGFSHSQLRNNGKTMAVICCHIDTSLVLSSTSTNGYLSATVPFLCHGGQSILWFLFKPLCNGHLTTRTINFTTKTRPQLQKNDQQRSVFTVHWWKSQKWPWNLIDLARFTLMINLDNLLFWSHSIYALNCL